MAVKQYALFVTESAFKSPVSPINAGNLNSAWAVLNLDDDDAFGVERTPNVEELASARSFGGPDRAVGDTYGVAGPIKGILYPEHTSLLCGWGMAIVDQTPTPKVPWVTSEPNGRDLASATFAHFYEDWAFNGVQRRWRGCKAAQFTLESARGTRGGVVQFMADVVGSDEASSTDTEPLLTQYPTLAPYYFSNSALTVNNVAISNFESWRLQVQNQFEVAIDESTTAQVIRLQRRRITLSITGALKNTPDWRALYVGQGNLLNTRLVLTHPTAPWSATFALQGACRVSSWTAARRLQQRPNQTVEIVAQLDRSTGKDLVVTFT